MADAQCARDHPGISFLVITLLVASNALDRLHAARRLIAAGVHANAVALTGRLKELAPKSGTLSRNEFFCHIDEVTPLAIAVALNDTALVRELILLGANPCMVGFRLLGHLFNRICSIEFF